MHIVTGHDSGDRGHAGRGVPRGMRHRLRAFLPTAVVGRHYDSGQTLPNGDFTISHRDSLTGDPDRIERLQPIRR
ncbi:hypothetical protein ACIQRZ_18860 [Streptomyces rubiginosohelvolus]|uniref:hypothetical protein n=1 Tax=Streptomyces rubiginosohelvolus TaxID=67362 RepID=UPI00381D0F64